MKAGDKVRLLDGRPALIHKITRPPAGHPKDPQQLIIAIVDGQRRFVQPSEIDPASWPPT